MQDTINRLFCKVDCNLKFVLTIVFLKLFLMVNNKKAA